MIHFTRGWANGELEAEPGPAYLQRLRELDARLPVPARLSTLLTA